jgi:hypothetical protein
MGISVLSAIYVWLMYQSALLLMYNCIPIRKENIALDLSRIQEIVCIR